MVDFPQTVAPPGGASFQIPKIDFSQLANLPDDYFAGTQMKRQLDLQGAFKDGLPKDASGNIDYMAAANKLYSLGDTQGAGAMMQTALGMQGMGLANNFNKMLMGGAGAAPAAAGPQAPAPAPASAASNPAPAGPMSLGASINNPGDLRDNAWTRTLPGYTGAKGGFAAFDTPEHGVGATDANLSSYGRKGVNTPLAIASKWAPSGDGDNDPQAYAQHIAGALGIGVNDPINLNDTATRARLRDAMFSQEGTNQGPFAAKQPGAAAPKMSPAGGPWAADSKGNPVETDAEGRSVQGQTPAALHAANDAARKAATQPPPVPQAGPQAAPAAVETQAPPPPSAPVAPVPQPQPGPTAGQPLDPTLSGLIPQSWTAKGGTPGGYVTMLRAMAAVPNIPQNSRESWNKLADGIEQTISRSAAARTGAIAGFELGHRPGETIDQYNARAAAETKGAEETEADKHALVQIYPEDGGPAQWVPRSTTLPGGANAGALSERTPAVAEGQKAVMTLDQSLGPQYEGRQEARQRLQAIAKILQNYEPGAFAEQKADLAAALNGIGIPVSDANMANAASFQEFTKNMIANVFANVKTMGGRPLVAEITGLSKGAANPSLQPAANQAIVGQGLGLLDFEDKRAEDYWAWRQQHPHATSTAGFDLDWLKKNPPETFVNEATKNVAVKGIPIPDTAKRSVGQVYVTPKGPMRWMGGGWQAVQ